MESPGTMSGVFKTLIHKVGWPSWWSSDTALRILGGLVFFFVWWGFFLFVLRGFCLFEEVFCLVFSGFFVWFFQFFFV